MWPRQTRSRLSSRRYTGNVRNRGRLRHTGEGNDRNRGRLRHTGQ